MTRATMRTLLRRQLNETVADQWSDQELDDMLNVAAQMVSKEVLKVSPEGIVFIDNLDVTAGNPYIPLPGGFLYELAVGVLDSNSGLYPRIGIRDRVFGSALPEDSLQGYSRLGRFLVISPTPSVSTVAGIQLVYVGGIEMTSDDQVPSLPLLLHMAIPLYAKMLILGGETSEDYTATQKLLGLILDDLPSYFLPSAVSPPAVKPSLNKAPTPSR